MCIRPLRPPGDALLSALGPEHPFYSHTPPATPRSTSLKYGFTAPLYFRSQDCPKNNNVQIKTTKYDEKLPLPSLSYILPSQS